jgi:hypothetical protein
VTHFTSVPTNVDYIGDARECNCSPTVAPDNVAPPNLEIFHQMKYKGVLGWLTRIASARPL